MLQLRMRLVDLYHFLWRFLFQRFLFLIHLFIVLLYYYINYLLQRLRYSLIYSLKVL